MISRLQSLLSFFLGIWGNANSSGKSWVNMAIWVAILSTLAELGVAQVGSLIEVDKSLVQEWLLM